MNKYIILIKLCTKSLHLEGIFQIFFTSEGPHPPQTPPFEGCKNGNEQEVHLYSLKKKSNKSTKSLNLKQSIYLKFSLLSQLQTVNYVGMGTIPTFWGRQRRLPPRTDKAGYAPGCTSKSLTIVFLLRPQQTVVSANHRSYRPSTVKISLYDRTNFPTASAKRIHHYKNRYFSFPLRVAVEQYQPLMFHFCTIIENLVMKPGKTSDGRKEVHIFSLILPFFCILLFFLFLLFLFLCEVNIRLMQ